MQSTVTRFVLVLALSLSAAVASLSTASADNASHGPEHTEAISAKQVALQQAMRALWEDHVTWTRLFIVDFAADASSTDATTERLLANQVAIGDAIKPYYGGDAGDALTALLTDHILGAADLLAAAKAGDTAKVETASQRWFANGDEIASFLHAANPTFWPLAEMKAMMKAHLDNTVVEAVAHLDGDWPADIAAYDTVHQQILEMADMLSAGIIAQFPERFA
jgi:hypothetical protein